MIFYKNVAVQKPPPKPEGPATLNWKRAHTHTRMQQKNILSL